MPDAPARPPIEQAALFHSNELAWKEGAGLEALMQLPIPSFSREEPLAVIVEDFLRAGEWISVCMVCRPAHVIAWSNDPQLGREATERHFRAHQVTRAIAARRLATKPIIRQAEQEQDRAHEQQSRGKSADALYQGLDSAKL